MRQRFSTKGSYVILGISIAALQLSCLVAIAQTDGGSSPPANAVAKAALRPDLAFEVVSVRASPRGGARSISIAAAGDEFRAMGMPLSMAIRMAYFPVRTLSREQLVGAPGWVWDDEYDFVGKVAEADLPMWHQFTERGFMVPNPMLQIMLQNALTERCRMVVHSVSVQVDGYALVVTNRGPNKKNLVASKPDDFVPSEAVGIGLDASMIPLFPGRDPVLHFYQTSMAALALEMSGPFRVEDRTGIPGKYRFDLVRLGTEGTPTSDWDWAPLGLKLTPVKTPAKNIVIDHIERPSPN